MCCAPNQGIGLKLKLLQTHKPSTWTISKISSTRQLQLLIIPLPLKIYAQYVKIPGPKTQQRKRYQPQLLQQLSKFSPQLCSAHQRSLMMRQHPTCKQMSLAMLVKSQVMLDSYLCGTQLINLLLHPLLLSGPVCQSTCKD